MARHALLIGIQNYGMGIESVTAAPWDVRLAEMILRHRAVGYFDRVKVITDVDVDADGCLNGRDGLPDVWLGPRTGGDAVRETNAKSSANSPFFNGLHSPDPLAHNGSVNGADAYSAHWSAHRQSCGDGGADNTSQVNGFANSSAAGDRPSPHDSPQSPHSGASHHETGSYPGTRTVRHSDLAEDIQVWCRGHEPDDLALLLISGQIFCGADGELFLAASNTYITADGIADATTIPLARLGQWLNQSQAQRQVVVLDCCYGDRLGRTPPASSKSNDSDGSDGADDSASSGDRLPLESLLGADHRVILSAATAANYFTEQKQGQRSLYTHYWLEGLVTGAADGDGKGWISVADGHRYVAQQMAIALPNVSPWLLDCGSIADTLRLGKSCLSAAQREYRQIAQDHRSGPSISEVGRHILAVCRDQWGLAAITVELIEQQVLHPYQYYANSCQRYQDAVAEGLGLTPLGPMGRSLGQGHLDEWRQRLGLRRQDVAPINQDLTELQRMRHMQRYRQALQQAIATQYPLSPEDERSLKFCQQVLQLDNEDIELIEQDVMADRNTHQQRLTYYRHHFTRALARRNAPSPLMREELDLLRQQLGLSNDDVDQVERQAIRDGATPADSAPSVPPFPAAAPLPTDHSGSQPADNHTPMATASDPAPTPNPQDSHDHPPDPHYPNQEAPHQLEAGGDDTETALPSVPATAQYELAARAAIAKQYPFTDSDLQVLKQLQRTLALSDDQVRSIHERLRAELDQEISQQDANGLEANQPEASQQNQPGQWNQQDRLQHYQQQLLSLMEADGTISPANAEVLRQTQIQIELSDSQVQTLTRDVIAQRSASTSSAAEPTPEQPGAEPSQNPGAPSNPAIEGNSADPPAEPPTELESAAPEQPAAATTDAAPNPNAPAMTAISNEASKIKYDLLRTHLENKDWQKADQETLKLLLTTTPEPVSWMNPEAIRQLSCEYLNAVDELWREHSDGHFGFRVQYAIFEAIAPSEEKAIRFGKKVGWTLLDQEFIGFKYYNQLTFELPDPNVPRGHLPAKWFWQIPWWESVRSGGLGTGRGGCGSDAAQILATMMARFASCSALVESPSTADRSDRLEGDRAPDTSGSTRPAASSATATTELDSV